MWIAQITCPKCYRDHLHLWPGAEKPEEHGKYTSYCPLQFIPIYVEGGFSTVHFYKKQTIEKKKIQWKEVEKAPAESHLELKKWEPVKVVEIG